MNGNDYEGPTIGATRNWGSAFKRGLEAIFEAAADTRLQDKYGPDWRQRLEFERKQRSESLRGQALQRELQKQQIAEALAKGTAEELQGGIPELGGVQETAGRTKLGPFDVNLPAPGSAPTPEANLPPELLRTVGLKPEQIVARAKGKIAESRRSLQQLREQAAQVRAEAERAFRSGQTEKAQNLAILLEAMREMGAQSNIRLRAELRPPPKGRRVAQDVGEEARALETVRDARSDAYRRFAEGSIDADTFLQQVEDYTDRESELLGTARTATGEKAKMRQREQAQRQVATAAAARQGLKGYQPQPPEPRVQAPAPSTEPTPQPSQIPQAPGGQIRYQRNRRTGEIRYSKDGGQTWRPLPQ